MNSCGRSSVSRVRRSTVVWSSGLPRISTLRPDVPRRSFGHWSAGLVMVVTERVLGEGITIPGQEQLVDRAIAEIDRQASADGGSAELAKFRFAKFRLARCRREGAGLRRASGDESRRVSAFVADIGSMVAPRGAAAARRRQYRRAGRDPFPYRRR